MFSEVGRPRWTYSGLSVTIAARYEPHLPHLSKAPNARAKTSRIPVPLLFQESVWVGEFDPSKAQLDTEG